MTVTVSRPGSNAPVHGQPPLQHCAREPDGQISDGGHGVSWPVSDGHGNRKPRRSRRALCQRSASEHLRRWSVRRRLRRRTARTARGSRGGERHAGPAVYAAIAPDFPLEFAGFFPRENPGKRGKNPVLSGKVPVKNTGFFPRYSAPKRPSILFLRTFYV